MGAIGHWPSSIQRLSSAKGRETDHQKSSRLVSLSMMVQSTVKFRPRMRRRRIEGALFEPGFWAKHFTLLWTRLMKSIAVTILTFLSLRAKKRMQFRPIQFYFRPTLINFWAIITHMHFRPSHSYFTLINFRPAFIDLSSSMLY